MRKNKEIYMDEAMKCLEASQKLHKELTDVMFHLSNVRDIMNENQYVIGLFKLPQRLSSILEVSCIDAKSYSKKYVDFLYEAFKNDSIFELMKSLALDEEKCFELNRDLAKDLSIIPLVEAFRKEDEYECA